MDESDTPDRKTADPEARAATPETRARLSASAKVRWATQREQAQVLRREMLQAVASGTLAEADAAAQAGVTVLTLRTWIKEAGLLPPDTWQIRQRAASKARMERRWADPEVRARWSAASKARQEARWADPEERARFSASQKARWADPEERRRYSEAAEKRMADPEVLAQRSAAAKKQWADPEVRARLQAAAETRWANPQSRQRHPEATKARWAQAVLSGALLRTEAAAQAGVSTVTIGRWIKQARQTTWLSVAAKARWAQAVLSGSVTLPEAAAQAGVSRAAVTRWIKKEQQRPQDTAQPPETGPAVHEPERRIRRPLPLELSPEATAALAAIRKRTGETSDAAVIERVLTEAAARFQQK